MAQLAPGDPAPGFTLLDQNERPVSLSDFAGTKLVVYFYPRANTPGCTRQSCAVRDALPDLSGLGAAAVGISPDKPATQKRFDEKQGLGFPLLSDPDRAVARAWGAFGQKKAYGKVTEGIVRSAFVVDEQGRVAAAFYKVKPEDTVPKALAAIRG